LINITLMLLWLNIQCSNYFLKIPLRIFTLFNISNFDLLIS